MKIAWRFTGTAVAAGRMAVISLLLTSALGCATQVPSSKQDHGGGATGGSGAPQVVHLLAINDFHGNLQPPAPLREPVADAVPQPIGGVDVLAAYVRAYRARNPGALVVSAGDLVGASPLVSALFRDEGTIEAMNRLGLDANAVGNHEFDDGRDELLRLQQGGCHPSGEQTCMGAVVGTPVPFEGARFPFLAANVRDPGTGSTLFPPYTLRSVGDRRIAFIGLTLQGTPGIVDRAGIGTLTFLPEADTINALVPELRAQGVQAIVVLLHEGGDVTGRRDIGTINGCAGDLEGSPVRAIVSRLDDAVDLVVSGHTHQAYVCRLPNAKGRAIPVTSAHDYGRVATEIALTLDARGDVAAVTARNVPLLRDAPGVVPDATLAQLVARYAELARPLAGRVVGHLRAALPREPNAAGESPLGRTIADGQLAATRTAGAQIALMNPGGIRAGLELQSVQGEAANGAVGGEGGGAVTYGALFTVQPFANALVTMTLTGAQLHTLLEQQFQGCARGFPADRPAGQGVTRILQVSAGFSYAWRADAPACEHVPFDSLRLDGAPIVADQRYRITVNSFLAAGGDDFMVLREGTDAVTGMLDLAAMERWLMTSPPIDDTPRIRRAP